MDHPQPSPSDPNSSVDEITDFLGGFSISSPSCQRIHTGTSASTTPSITFDVGSYSSSSYTSQSYADSMPTTAPSLGSTVLPGNSEYILPCEFVGYDSCDQYFYPVDADQWMNHIIVDHLQNELPNKSNCWFCDSISFDAWRDHTDRASSFRNRLEHIRSHIRDEHLGIRNMRPDYDFVAHIWKRGLISRNVYEAARGWREGPVSNVTSIFPHFIPEEQIQRYESHRVIVSEPRERERSHRHKSHRNYRGHSRKSSNFGMPADTFRPTAKQDGQSSSSNQMALNSSRSQSSRPDHTIPETPAKDTSDAAVDQDFDSSIDVPQTALHTWDPASQNDQRAEHWDVFHGGANNKNNFEDTRNRPHTRGKETRTCEPSLEDNKGSGADVDLESHSSKTIGSGMSLPGDPPAKNQCDISLSQSPDSPEPVDVLTPDSSDSFRENDAPYTPSFTRQVGVARVRIEQLSLFDQVTTNCEQYTDVSTHSEGSQHENDDCPAETESDASGSQHSGLSGAPRQESCSTTKRPRPNTGNETEAEDSNPDENQERRKPDQKKQKRPSCGLPRFACPYQAFEPFQNCFKPHALNPKGGCENIARIKHHLKRRHNQAYRCRRCWSSFDSREKVKEHETKNQCEHRAMSQTERIMNAQSEAGIENACKSVPAIEAWWNLFRLLISGMQGRDLESLIQEYGPNYPYYFRREPNLILPPVMLSNNIFEPVSQAEPSQETVFTRSSDHQDLLTPRDFNLNVASTTYAMQPMPSQTFSVPVFQGFNVEAAGNSFVNLHDTVEASVSAQGSSSFDFVPSSSNLQSLPELPFMPENPASVSSASNQGQLRRKYERLRERNIQAEADIATSRQAVQEAGSDLTLLNNIFEDLLNSDDLPDELFDKISQASSTLTSARRKLQRAAL